MSNYQVIARRFRPQTFKEVVGQDAIVTTLKNAIKNKRLAHAYLFCGPRGTGKTTLARLFAKALNCQNLSQNLEPCSSCSSCREIASGSSLDVIEIDGASHRGIEDIRQINETVGYSAASGGYKIYIIDEVHMLTKEAFNALLKTLEEPPAHVKFFFATTEPHKVLPTILSRCQRFNLNRIPLDNIVKKLKFIAETMQVKVEDEALRLLAQYAEGGLRDAESLFDQILAFESEQVTVESIQTIFGLMSRSVYFLLDKAGKEGNFAVAFEIADRIFSEGKDLLHFIEGLIEHFRTLLLMHLAPQGNELTHLSQEDQEKYQESVRLYTQEQCLTNIEFLLEAQNKLRFSSSSKIYLESILLHIMRSHFRIPIDYLVRRLKELEQTVAGNVSTPLIEDKTLSPPPQVIIKPEMPQTVVKSSVTEDKAPSPPPQLVIKPETLQTAIKSSVTEDPTPTAKDLGVKIKKSEVKRSEAPPHFDNLLQFAAVELEGKIQRELT